MNIGHYGGAMTRELGELEDTVMTHLWGADAPMTVREVQDALKKRGRTLAYTTVATVMDNLHAKRWVTRALTGRAFQYTAVASRDEYAAGLMKRAWERSGDPAACFTALLSIMTEQQRTAMDTALRSARPSPQRSTSTPTSGGTLQ